MICTVLENGIELGKYHLKTHSAITRDATGEAKVDLRELFVYKLLELIEVGPEVHFFGNTHGSVYGVYIVRKDGEFLKLP